MNVMIGLGRILLVITCVFSTIGFLLGMANADSAIQEAAIAASCATVVIIPYVLLRAMAGFGDK